MVEHLSRVNKSSIMCSQRLPAVLSRIGIILASPLVRNIRHSHWHIPELTLLYFLCYMYTLYIYYLYNRANGLVVKKINKLFCWLVKKIII